MVGTRATSMLSFTANGTPARGSSAPAASRASTSATPAPAAPSGRRGRDPRLGRGRRGPAWRAARRRRRGRRLTIGHHHEERCARRHQVADRAHHPGDRAADGARDRRLGLHRLERDHGVARRHPVALGHAGPGRHRRAAAPPRRTRRRRARRGRRSDDGAGSVDRFRMPGELAGGFPSGPLVGERGLAARSGRRGCRRRGRSRTRGVRRGEKVPSSMSELEPAGARRRPAARAARRRRPGTSGCGRSCGATTVHAGRVRGASVACSTPGRCGRRTGSRPGPPCRRRRGTRRRCPPRSRESTCAPGCTSW